MPRHTHNPANISIHAPREGGDRSNDYTDAYRKQFQSTPPARGATAGRSGADGQPLFQSTPPARGATTAVQEDFRRLEISIHAPREGGDGLRILRRSGHAGISIHAPREGGDAIGMIVWDASVIFQSTPPARGATIAFVRDVLTPRDFNPRPPRGGRLPPGSSSNFLSIISIHAPREGGDCGRHICSAGWCLFQSTPPARGATKALSFIAHSQEFQSTPPARGATLRENALNKN